MLIALCAPKHVLQFILTSALCALRVLTKDLEQRKREMPERKRGKRSDQDMKCVSSLVRWQSQVKGSVQWTLPDVLIRHKDLHARPQNGYAIKILFYSIPFYVFHFTLLLSRVGLDVRATNDSETSTWTVILTKFLPAPRSPFPIPLIPYRHQHLLVLFCCVGFVVCLFVPGAVLKLVACHSIDTYLFIIDDRTVREASDISSSNAWA